MELITGSVGASSAASQPSQEKLVWAVRIASAHVPPSTCLTQALAGQLLFERYGYPATVHIGVTAAGPDDGGIKAACECREENDNASP